MSEKKAVILVQYKGGGYSGCFWEWNFCLVDSLKRMTIFEDIISSGSNGITTLEQARRLKDESDVYAYDLRTKKGWAEFDKEANPAHVSYVATWLLKNHEDLYHPLKCDHCGKELDIDECYLGGYKGQGGLAIAPMLKTCEECDIKDAWDSWVKDYILDELRRQDVEFEGVSPEDVDRILLEAIDYTSACWEGEGDDRHLYGADEVVEYIVENPGYVKRMLCKDVQTELV